MAKSECQSESENRIQIYQDELNERSELNQSESTRNSHSHSDLVPLTIGSCNQSNVIL
jgi:hypothetical protein